MSNRGDTIIKAPVYRSHLDDFRLFATVHRFFLSLWQMGEQLHEELDFDMMGLEQEIVQFTASEALNEREIEIAARLSVWRQALEKFDADLSPAALRHYFEQIGIPDTTTLEMILAFYLSKSVKNENDRDKIDLIATWWGQFLLQNNENENFCLTQLPHLRERLDKIYHDLGLSALSMNEIRDTLEILEFERKRLMTVRTLREMIEKQLLARLRKLKSSLGDLLFQPAILSEVVALNVNLHNIFKSLFLAEQSRLSSFFQQGQKKKAANSPVTSYNTESFAPVEMPKLEDLNILPKMQNLTTDIVALHMAATEPKTITLDRSELLKSVQTIRTTIMILDQTLTALVEKIKNAE